ncbi:MAG: Lrp/AsnC family transcriptional regulator [Nitrospinota bacterium]
MDAIDVEILNKLQRNGRATGLEIAKAVGLTSPSVAERIRRLESDGVIRGYAALLDFKELGKDITAFIHVSIEFPTFHDPFIQAIQGLNTVQECYRVTGEHAYILKVRVENTEALDRLLMERIRAIEGVNATVTSIVLASVKEEVAIPLAGGTRKKPKAKSSTG